MANTLSTASTLRLNTGKVARAFLELADMFDRFASPTPALCSGFSHWKKSAYSMVSHVSTACHHLKVDQAIIQFVTILMVNNLIWREFTANVSFHDKPMRWRANSTFAGSVISIGVNGAISTETNVNVPMAAPASVMHRAPSAPYGQLVAPIYRASFVDKHGHNIDTSSHKLQQLKRLIG